MVLCQGCKQMALDKSWSVVAVFQTNFSTKPNPPSPLCWSNNLDHPQTTTLVAFQLAKRIEKKRQTSKPFQLQAGLPRELTTGMDHWNGSLKWTTGIDTRTCSIVATKACKHSEAALNRKFSVAHIIIFLKFKTYIDG